MKIIIYGILLLSAGLGCILQGCESASYPYSQDPAVIAEGNKLFDNYCVACHNFNVTGIGPNLSGFTREVSEEWAKGFIRNPMEVIQAGDERGAHLFEEFKQYMPPFSTSILPEEELDAILAYLHTRKARPETPTRTDWGELVRNPVSEPIQSSGITLILKEYAQAPYTEEEGQKARINKIAPIGDGSSRLFVHDLRGKLYELKESEFQLFLDLAAQFPAFIHTPGHGTGMGSFAFHPEYAENGLFYTTHTVNPDNGAIADFSLDDSIPVKMQCVLTEWKMKNPDAESFEGTHREILRVDLRTQIHGVQEIAFNPTVQSGEEDYGLLYIGIGDAGSGGRKYNFLVQTKQSVYGTLLRIDPLGNTGKNSKYGIPSSNPFVKEKGAFGEIYALGLRNPHRFTWDGENGGRMLASDIGQHQVEELNIIIPGANYGWPEREGTYRLDKEGDIAKIYPLPEVDQRDFVYPVAQFDHDEGLAICGGYVYQGSAVPELQGKYIFGEIVNGRVFLVDAADLELGKQAVIQDIALELENGEPAEWPELTDNVRTGHSRVDFRMGVDSEGELYLSTKANGKIFKVVGMKAKDADLL